MWNVDDFQAQSKRDSEIAMQHDLDAIIDTAPANQKEVLITLLKCHIDE